MDALGINVGLLIIQFFFVAIFVGLPIVTLIDMSKKKLSGTPLAVWALVICVVPIIGAIAYWILKPTSESKA